MGCRDASCFRKWSGCTDVNRHGSNFERQSACRQPSTDPKYMSRYNSLLWLLLFCTLTPCRLPSEALRINRENSEYFLFRGKPLVLISASEHYGSVINLPCNFNKYLADAAEHKMTMTRTFLLFRELQRALNPSSPCKLLSPDYNAPYVRVGPRKSSGRRTFI